MARKKTPSRPIETYEHQDKQCVNNPPVGLVTPDPDPDAGLRQTCTYAPHLCGTAVSLHVYERIDPRTIIEIVADRGGESLKVLEVER